METVSQTYRLWLSGPQDVLQVIVVIAVIVNSALKRNRDCFSDILTVLVWSTGCAAGDGGDCGDCELSPDRDGRFDAQNSAWSLRHAHPAAPVSYTHLTLPTIR